MSKEILVVDDDPDLINLLDVVLTRAGYRVSGVTSGEEAVKAAEQLHPDLIILDVMMPGMSGWEVHRRIRGHEEVREIPVLMLTAKNSDLDKMMGLHVADVDEYITKPFDSQELVHVVRRTIAESQSPLAAALSSGQPDTTRRT